jgi:lysine 2,3-aminomutase
MPLWRQELRQSLTTVEHLVAAGLVSGPHAQALAQTMGAYRFALPRPYAELIDRQDLGRCPIFRQAVPASQEADKALPEWAQALSQRAYGRPTPWQADAIGDLAHLAAPRLTHRYGNRALLHVSMACALYCRFCFRKAHLKAGEQDLYGGSLEPALAYLGAHPEIDEIILTGGDPLSMVDGWLERLMAQLALLPNIRMVRLHSRMATTLPSRLTEGLWQALAKVGSHQQVALVSHFNHPRELTRAALAHLAAGRRHGVVLLNQATLLHGVNDDVEVLYALCQKLWHGGIVPYYLHHPDWVPATFHFRVAIDRGRALVGQLAGRVSGPALPAYVLDVPFGRGKVRLMETTVRKVPNTFGQDADMEGGLWQIDLPHTRTEQGGSALYLDLAAPRVDGRTIPF